jgi:hypothetical protein
LSEDKFAQSRDRHASGKWKVESVVLPVEKCLNDRDKLKDVLGGSPSVSNCRTCPKRKVA